MESFWSRRSSMPILSGMLMIVAAVGAGFGIGGLVLGAGWAFEVGFAVWLVAFWPGWLYQRQVARRSAGAAPPG